MKPEIRELPAFHVVGMCGWYDPNRNAREIPKLWERFVPRLKEMPEPVGGRSWGVCFGTEAGGSAPGSFFYMAALETPDLSDIPDDMVGKTIPAQRYAVFTHKGPLSTFHDTVGKIWSEWLPASGHAPSGGPDLELYDERFHPEHGQIEVWAPIRS